MKTAVIGLICALLCACSSIPREGGDQKRAKYHHDLAYGHFFENKDGDAALQEILQSLKAYEKDPSAHLLAGLIFTGRSDWLTAMKHYKRALELKPTFYEVKNNLGTLYLTMGQWERAIKIFKELTQEIEYATPAMGYNNLGWAHYKMGDLQSAQGAFITATQLNPRLCPPHNNIGMIYFKQGDDERAERSLQRAIKQCPQYAEPHLHLGQIHMHRRDIDLAFKSLKRCQEIGADSPIGVRCDQLLSQQKRYPPTRR